MHRIEKSIAIIMTVVLVAALAVVTGCSTSDEGQMKENRAPNVWLASAPPEGSTDKYTIQMFWGGWDPDGEIAYYEYAITNNEAGGFQPKDTVGADKWSRVYANDSTFTFTADVLVDSNTTDLVTEFVRSHTFFIRSVDEQGLASLEPAYRSFTARTLSPEVNIAVPRQTGLSPALVPSITTFRWTAQDYVDNLLTPQEPDSVSWALVSADSGFAQTIDFLRKGTPRAEAEWGDWVYYAAPEDSGKFWTTEPLDLGPYIFAIRAKDEAGAITPVLDEKYNVRRIRVSQRSSGPIMNVTNQYLGTVTTSVCNTPLVILDLPAGVPLQFAWNASATSYGGVVSGYRYGWDISDLSDPDQWETDFTPFTSTRATSPPRTFFFGTHTFSVEVVDNSGFCSRAEIKVNIVQFTFQKNLLLFDDFTPDNNSSAGWNASGRGILPSDSEHDAFWEYVLDDLEGFDPEADVLEVREGVEVPLTEVASYKSIIWSAYGDRAAVLNLPLLYSFIQHRQKNPTTGGTTGKRQPNLLALFMAAGGHVFINGTHPMSNAINRNLAGGIRYPMIFLYEVEGQQTRTPDPDRPIGDQNFAYHEMCLDVLDYCVLGSGTRRNDATYCDVLTQRRLDGNYLRDDTMREAIPLDSNFPRLTLRPECSATGKAYQPSEKGLNAEVYNPQYFFDECDYTPSKSRDCFQPIYGLECFDTSEPIYGQPVAFWSSEFADVVPEQGGVGARSVVFGFAPVYFKPTEVRPAIEYILFEEWQLPRKP